MLFFLEFYLKFCVHIHIAISLKSLILFKIHFHPAPQKKKKPFIISDITTQQPQQYSVLYCVLYSWLCTILSNAALRIKLWPSSWRRDIFVFSVCASNRPQTTLQEPGGEPMSIWRTRSTTPDGSLNTSWEKVSAGQPCFFISTWSQVDKSLLCTACVCLRFDFYSYPFVSLLLIQRQTLYCLCPATCSH